MQYTNSAKRWEKPFQVASLMWCRIQPARPLIVIPIYWALDLIKAILHPIFGKYIGRNVIKVRQPNVSFRHELAGHSYTCETDEKSLHEMVKRYILKLNDDDPAHSPLSVIFNKVTTEDGESTLDTLHVSHQDFFDLPTSERKVTLVLSGNTVRYEHNYALKMMRNEIQNEDGTIEKDRMAVTFNYPGVGSSTGPLDDIEDLFEAARAQYVRLLAMNIKPENITIRGHSLGGFIAYRLLLEAHNNKQFSKALIDRSSPSIGSIVEGYVWEAFDRKGFSMLGRVVSLLCRPVIHSILWLAHFENSSVQYLGTIDPRYLKFTTLRTAREEREKTKNFVGDDRNIVHKPASFYFHLKNVVRKGRQYTRSQLKSKMDFLLTTLDTSNQEDASLADALVKARSDLRSPKYYTDVKPTKDAHGRPMEHLISRQDGVTNMWNMYKTFRDTPVPSVDPIVNLEHTVDHELKKRGYE